MASGPVAGQPLDEAETPSSNLAKRNGDEDEYVPQNTEDRPMHDETPVQQPDYSPYVGRDGGPLPEDAARTAGAGAILLADMANPSGTDSADNNDIAA